MTRRSAALPLVLALALLAAAAPALGARTGYLNAEAVGQEAMSHGAAMEGRLQPGRGPTAGAIWRVVMGWQRKSAPHRTKHGTDPAKRPLRRPPSAGPRDHCWIAAHWI